MPSTINLSDKKLNLDVTSQAASNDPELLQELLAGITPSNHNATLRYNCFRVSSNLRAARPGDLLFFQQPTQRQPYHVMLFVGHSHFQPQGSDWIVYHTGELNGGRGEIREVEASLLDRHPDPRWRPLETNPHFLGVYRFALLR